MKKYQVIALSVGGKRNKIFHSGDVVFEHQFPEGAFPKLVEEGFLKSLEEEPHEIIIPDDPETGDQIPDDPNAGDTSDESEFNIQVNDLDESTDLERFDKEEELEKVEDPDSLKQAFIQIPSIEEIEVVDIKQSLDLNNISYGKNESKQKLYDKYVDLLSKN